MQDSVLFFAFWFLWLLIVNLQELLDYFRIFIIRITVKYRQFYKRHYKKKKVLCDLYTGVDHGTTIQMRTFFLLYILWFYLYSYHYFKYRPRYRYFIQNDTISVKIYRISFWTDIGRYIATWLIYRPIFEMKYLIYCPI